MEKEFLVVKRSSTFKCFVRLMQRLTDAHPSNLFENQTQWDIDMIRFPLSRFCIIEFSTNLLKQSKFKDPTKTADSASISSGNLPLFLDEENMFLVQVSS